MPIENSVLLDPTGVTFLAEIWPLSKDSGLTTEDGGTEMDVLRLILAFLRVFFGSQAALAAENLALRHQLAVLQRSVRRPKLRRSDRIFWSMVVWGVARLQVRLAHRPA